VFHMDVVKVDRDVAHVIMAIHVMHVPNVSSVFNVCLQVFRLDVVYVSCKCCKSFYLDVAYAFQ
jgi:hypothetical protein